MSRLDNLTRLDWIAAAVLCVTAAVIFGVGATRLGFYYDDSTWMVEFRSFSPDAMWSLIRDYIPGRNLFPLWQYILYKMVGDPPSHLAALHVLQSMFDGLAVAAFFLLLRSLSLPGSASVVAAGLFSFWPIHGETHYWHTSLAANVLPALFVILFALASALLVRHRGAISAGLWRLWLLDATTFLCALFTYDQGVLALLAIVAFRLAAAVFGSWERRWSFVCAHLPYLTAAVFWMRLRLSPTSSPRLGSGAWQMLWTNLPRTISDTFGAVWFRQVAPLVARATFADWILALLAAVAITGVALWVFARPSEASSHLRVWPFPSHILVLAVCFYFAAYLPIWLWQIAPRHHYLPSVGLFAGAGACLAWILNRLPSRALRFGVVVATGGATLAFAAASRGESRFWEEAFTAKRQLLAELEPDLKGKQAVVLEGFPFSLGPAFLLVPQDAAFGPRILYPSLDRYWSGDVGGAPAPGGVFLRTLTRFHGWENFRYYPADKVLVARFTGWDKGRFRYEKNPTRPPHYQIISEATEPYAGPFAVRHVGARREHSDTLVSLELDVNLPPESHLAAVLSVFENGGFHRWGRFDPQGGFELQPILLISEPATVASGGRWRATLKLREFPPAERLQFEFFAVGRQPPVRLGHAETAVEP